MKIISRYVSRSVAAATFVVLVAVVGLDFVFRLVGDLDNMKGSYTFGKVFVYTLMETPLQLYSLMPLAAMIGCLVGLGSLAGSSELIVIRATGVSTLRLTWLALKPALVFLLMTMAIGEYVAPAAEEYGNSVRATARAGQKQIDLRSVFWVRDGNSFIFVRLVRPDGEMHGVNIFEFDDDQSLTMIRRANKATYEDGQWLLKNVRITDLKNVDGLPVEIGSHQQKQMMWKSDLQPALLSIAAAKPTDLQMQQLWTYISYLDDQSLNSVVYQLAFWEKVFYPLVMVSLVLIGIAFVFGPLRQVTMGYRIFWGVLVGVLVKTLQNALGPVSIVFGFSPVMAMAVPAFVCMGIGFILLRRVR
ncbi:Lipopolysaccharide export system permease protein LptG [BD1-7 clade bacterium]|uniref:Lipopolysaccharide export system permease protein LptG n=1 Tax=BD1-7 clade bacterium TaxID=2029982 RepID=A0A5S9QI50_9GAMM|nr:Lipopolysaccharide export system permease protein LptG [BD1-7 clade bacterium]CAA0117840.1 Lipopolysaccharide export system permease protein LptG [BD1-7 clade bacterium]